jgi:hypothetical protein
MPQREIRWTEGGGDMPLFMDVHESLPEGASTKDLAGAHAADADARHEAATRFVEAVAAMDYRGIFGAMTPDARFRFLLPGGPGQIVGAADVAAKFFQWFGNADVAEVQSMRVEPLPDRMSARYRFLVHEQEGWEVIEQQMYLDMNEEGRIRAIDLLCSGFRAVA